MTSQNFTLIELCRRCPNESGRALQAKSERLFLTEVDLLGGIQTRFG
jgi:hypothetical protein